MNDAESARRHREEELPRFLLVAPDLEDEEITTLARMIIGSLPAKTPIRSSPLPSKN